MSFYAQVMIAGLVGLGAVAMFHNRPLVLHCLIAFLYVFRYELTNKITFMMVLAFAAVHLTRGKALGERNGVLILTLGFVVFFARGLSFLFYRVDDLGLVFRETVVSYVNAVVWAYLLYATIRDVRGIMTFLGIYALMRAVESGVGGLLLYHFPDTALQFVLEKRNLGVEAETTLTAFSRDERLMSLAGMNPVDTSFHLCLCITFLMGRMVNKARALDVVAVLVCALSLIYTWSRTGWVGLAASLGIFSVMLYTPKVLVRYAAAIVLLGGVVFYEAGTIQDRYYSDNRNLAESTVTLRVVLQKQYLAKITEYGLFGVGLPNQQIPLHLNISPPISSESMFISAMVETGWVGALAFITLVALAGLRSFSSMMACRRRRKEHPENYYAAVTLFAAFVILTFMSMSFYLSWSDPITWLMIGLIFSQEEVTKRLAHLPRMPPHRMHLLQRPGMGRAPRSV